MARVPGGPVGATVVAADDWGGSRWTDRAERVAGLTDEEGRFSLFLGDLPCVRDRRVSRIRIWAEGKGVLSRAHALQVQAGRPLVASLCLEERSAIEVLVRDRFGLPLVDAEVQSQIVDTVPDRRMPWYWVTGRTDQNGRLAGWLPKGGAFTHLRSIVESQTFPMRVMMNRRWHRDHLKPTLSGRILYLQVPSFLRVKGRVVEADGTPAENLLVSNRTVYSWFPGQLEPHGKTDPNGHFELSDVDDVAKALYVFKDVAPPARRNDRQLRLIGVHSIALSHLQEGVRDLGEIRLPARRTVRVAVTGTQGAPLQGVVGLLTPDRLLPHAAGSLNDEGVVELFEVPLGIAHMLSIDVSLPGLTDVVWEQPLPLVGSDDVAIKLDGKGLLVAKVWPLPGRDSASDFTLAVWADGRVVSSSWNARTWSGYAWLGTVKRVRIEVDGGGYEGTLDDVEINPDGPTVVVVPMQPLERDEAAVDAGGEVNDAGR